MNMEYLTLKEVAKLFRVSVDCLRKRCKRGDIPYSQPIKEILIPKAWVMAQLEIKR